MGQIPAVQVEFTEVLVRVADAVVVAEIVEDRDRPVDVFPCGGEISLVLTQHREPLQRVRLPVPVADRRRLLERFGEPAFRVGVLTPGQPDRADRDPRDGLPVAVARFGELVQRLVTTVERDGVLALDPQDGA